MDIWSRPCVPSNSKIPMTRGVGTSNCVHFSSSQIFHPLTEEFSAMCDLVQLAKYVVSRWCHGPGTANCVRYCQNFILSDFSSSHRRVVSNVWPGTTSYIHYFLVMSLGTHNHNPHPPTPQHLPSSKHHSSSWWIQTACMKDANENPWHMAMGSQKVYISTVFQLCPIRRHVCTTWL